MIEKKGFPQPEVETYRREELELPVIMTGEAISNPTTS